jgi:hypothetical protein
LKEKWNEYTLCDRIDVNKSDFGLVTSFVCLQRWGNNEKRQLVAPVNWRTEYEKGALLLRQTFSFRHQSEDWFAASLNSALLSGFLFISTYIIQPTSFIICFVHARLGLPL